MALTEQDYTYKDNGDGTLTNKYTGDTITKDGGTLISKGSGPINDYYSARGSATNTNEIISLNQQYGYDNTTSPILQPQQFDIDAFMSQITNQMNQQLSSFQQQLLNNQSVLSDSLTQNQLNLGNMFKVGTTQNQLNLNANNRFRSGLNGASITPSPKQQAVSRYMANDIWKDKIRGDVNG